MKKGILFFFGLIFLLFTIKAQTNFYTTFGIPFNMGRSCVMQLPDSGYIVYNGDNSSNLDQELRRLDKNGNVIWHKKMISASTNEEAGAMMLSSKNHILIAGRYNSTSVNLFRLDLNGNIIFKKVYSGSNALPTKIVEDASGNIYLIGAYAELLKTDSTGTLKWKKSYPQTNYIESIIPVSTNKIILVGTANWVVDVFSTDLVHFFIDSMGVVINRKGFGTSAEEYTQDAFMDSSGKIYTSLYQINNATKDTSVGFMCTDTSGNQLWTRTVKGSFINKFSGALLKDNSLILYAAQPFGSNQLFYILHFSNDGKLLDHSVIPSSTSFYTGVYPFIGATSDGGYFLLGWDNLFNNYGLMKVGPNLYPSCKSTIQKSSWERKILLNETQYVLPASILVPSTSISTYSLTPITPTFVSSCSSTCNTTASFVGPAGNICMGTTITFTNNGKNFSSSIWKINGSAVATSTNLNYTFSSPGSHTVTSVVTGACIDSTRQFIFVDSLPNPNFTWTKKLAKVKFQASKYKNGTLLSWNFGDGSPVNACYDTIIHNYMSNGTYTVCLTETNTCGTKQACKTVSISPNYTNSFYWQYKHPGAPSANQSGVSLLQMADGGYFLAGSDDSYSGTGNGLLNRLDSAGNLKRSIVTSVGGGYIDCSTRTPEGGALISGSSISPYRQFFGKIDSTGTAFHATTLPVTSTDRVGNNLLLPDECMVYCGGASSQGYMVLTRKNLDVKFFRKYNVFWTITAIRKSPSGNFYAYGNNAANSDPVLMKMDSVFNVLWVKQFDLGATQCLTTDMQISSAGKIYMTGVYNPIVGGSAFLISTDSAGNTIFASNYKRSNPAYDYGRNLFIDKKGNILLNSYNTYANGAAALIKMDTMGNTLSVHSFSMSVSRLLRTYDDGISMAGSYKGAPTSSTAYSVTAIKLDSSSVLPCWGTTTITRTPLTPTITTLSVIISTTTPVFSAIFSSSAYNASDTLMCGGPLLVTGFSSFEKNNSIKIFPNPVIAEVTITSDEEPLEIELINGVGQTFFTDRSGQTKITIDLRHYDEGIYFIKVKNKSGMINSKKIIKLN